MQHAHNNTQLLLATPPPPQPNEGHKSTLRLANVAGKAPAPSKSKSTDQSTNTTGGSKTVVLVSDSFDGMRAYANDTGLSVSAYMNLTGKQRTRDWQYLCQHIHNNPENPIWIHVGRNLLNKPNAYRQPAVANIKQLLNSEHKNVLFECEARHWLPQFDDKNPIDVFTCGLTLPHCRHYRAHSVPSIKAIPCVCGQLGKHKRVTEEERETAYLAFCAYVQGTFADALAFPTEAALRQKAARDVRESELEKEGLTKEEVRKKTRQRKPQQQEQVFDDCGSDTGPIEDQDAQALLALPTGGIDEAIAHSFFDDVSLGDFTDSEDENCLREDFVNHYLFGSETKEEGVEFRSKHPQANFVALSDVDIYLPQDHLQGKIDIVEIFGGSGGVTKIAIRRKSKSGGNFDLVTGADLTNPSEVEKLLKLIIQLRPWAVILAPPCTAFANWSRLNRIKYPESYVETRRTGSTDHVDPNQS